MSEPEPRRLGMEEAISLAESFQNQLEAFEAERQALAAVEIECETTARAIETLQGGAKDDVLVPLGAGTFVHAKLGGLGPVVTPVGAGVHVGMDADGARQTLKDRAGDARKARETLESTMGRLQSQLDQLLNQIRAAQASAGAPPEG